ncbi:hypothetical protein K4K57_002595 [Colletotrichum sp. SAR 10_99]|nr:hypothetical protein K4K55_002742 [Colletotrichum sp. SAR 10_96]KAI8271501.1 hypothetical protein K4K56_003235 [Colletotrichum sp. SAR 10_98]KAJ5013526.1 hypothetical protein K4K57_002595 [Colletotrichum sp. SAR 10_99]
MASTFSSLFIASQLQLDAERKVSDDGGKLEGLEGLPLEIIFDIYQQLDVRSIFSLAKVNTLFHGLLKKNRAVILLPVLQREFSPFDELLQVYTASDQDLGQYGDTFQPRRVVFRRFPGDVSGVTLSQGGIRSDSAPSPEQVLFTRILNNGKSLSATTLPAPRSVAVNDRDFDSLLKYCLIQDMSSLDRMIENTIRERIVDTYAKLDPRDLMFYFENLFNYPRKRLVTDVNLRHPNFSRDQESLEAAVQAVVDERPWLYEVDDLSTVGGIVDDNKEYEDRLNNDGTIGRLLEMMAELLLSEIISIGTRGAC